MATTFDHIHLRCQDVDAAVRFYVDNLGAEVLGQGEALGMPITRVGLAGLVLSFSPPRQGVEVKVAGDEPGWGLYQLGLNVDSLDEVQARLAANGIQFCRGPVQVNDNLKVAFVDAPDGVEIELMQRS